MRENLIQRSSPLTLIINLYKFKITNAIRLIKTLDNDSCLKSKLNLQFKRLDDRKQDFNESIPEISQDKHPILH